MGRPAIVTRASLLNVTEMAVAAGARHIRPMRLLLLLALASTSPDTLRAPGLSRPVEILRDGNGISHIYAQNEHDLFFAQGYVAASDRLFQLELWRRQATGIVAELLGPRELARDVGARLFKFRGDMQTELAHYHPHGAAIVRAFVDGINAYIGETERDPSKLSLEFRLLNTKPGRWTPDVVVSRHGGLLGNIVNISANGQNKGIPFLIQGTTSNPSFLPAIGGLGNGFKSLVTPQQGQQQQNPSDGLGGLLGNILNKKKKQ